MRKIKIFGLISTGIIISTSMMPIIADTKDVPINETTLTSIPKVNSESNNMVRNLGGVTGRWFVINGKNEFFSPTINIQKDSTAPIEFSKIISQNSGSSSNFSEKVLFSDAISIKALPEVIVPSGTTYSIEYTIDKTTFNSMPPADITSLKGIIVTFSKMNASERVEIKNSAIVNWNNTQSGPNDLAQFFEDDRLQSTIYFDSYRMVTATYKDESGADLSEPEVFYGVLGDKYNTSARTIPGYKLTVMPNNASGQFSDDDQTVSYIYKKEVVAGGDVTVNYVDEDGKAIPNVPAQTINGNIGDSYDATTDAYKLEIPGYTLDENNLPSNGKGILSDKAQMVTYVYKQIKDQSVVIVHDSEITVGDEWKPEDNFSSATDYYGNVVPFSDISVEGQVDTTKEGIYKVTYKRLVPNFYLTSENQGSYSAVATITVKDAQPVKGGDVITKYVDADGNKITDDTVKMGNIGETYNTEQKNIEGYTFKEVHGNITGQFTDQIQTVNYVYTKNKLNPVSPKTKPDNKRGSKGNKEGTTSSERHSLPATGENERLMTMNIILGLILIALGAVLSVFHIKKVNK